MIGDATWDEGTGNSLSDRDCVDFISLPAQPPQLASRASASAERSLRSRCRSRACNVKRRRSCARRRGHSSAAKAATGARNMRCASCQESAESPLALPLRCSGQNRPSPSVLKLASPRRQRLAAGRAMGNIRQQAHQPRHPKLEIGQRHPGLLDRGLLQHGDQQAEDRLLGIVIGQRLVQQLGKKAEHRHAHGIDRRGKRGAEDFQLIQPHQLLPMALGKPGAG